MPEKTQPRAVFLLGFMGAGKTSVGRVLAQRLAWPFVDLDHRIEARAASSVVEIFHKEGEAAFRKAERAALEELLEGLEGSGPLVVALGGGAFVQEDNRRLLGRAGAPVIFLDAPAEVLLQRCQTAAATRPLLEDEPSFRALYDARRPHYLRATRRVDTAGKGVEAIAEEIALWLRSPRDRKTRER